MVMETQRLPVETLARAAAAIAATEDLRTALHALADAAAEPTGADLAVLRVLDVEGNVAARGLAPEASEVGAEIAGSRTGCDPVAAGEVPEATRRAAERARAAGTLVVAARAGGRVVGSVELIRVAEPFDHDDHSTAELVAAQLALAVRTLGADAGSALAARRAQWLDLAGEALAAGGDARRAEQQAVRIAAETSGARAGVLWRVGDPRTPELVASVGSVEPGLDRAREVVTEWTETWRPASIEHDPLLPGQAPYVATLPLGQPVFAVLQLFYAEDAAPGVSELPALGAFAARAAHALRSGERAREVELELDRTRALLEVVGEAIARLSLTHTLETAVERIAELLQVDQVGVYLREDGRLFAAAGRDLAAGHDDVADRVAEAFAGPLRARASLHARVGGDEPALASVRTALATAGQYDV